MDCFGDMGDEYDQCEEFGEPDAFFSTTAEHGSEWPDIEEVSPPVGFQRRDGGVVKGFLRYAAKKAKAKKEKKAKKKVVSKKKQAKVKAKKSKKPKKPKKHSDKKSKKKV
jgi:hypothetical protein